LNGTILGREPALIAGLINAGIALAITFGLHLTQEQVGAIMAFTNLALAVIVRQVVTPVAAPKLEVGADVNGGAAKVTPA
jgi:hypothetical protein